MEEACIKKVQDCVLDATHVLIDGKPVVSGIGIEHALIIVGAGESRVVPRRLHERIKGIGFALARDTVEIKFTPFRVRFDRRSNTIHDDIFWQ